MANTDAMTPAGDIDISHLPALPQVLLELLDACHDPEVSFVQLAELIGREPSLTARILALASSPLYGPSRRIESLDHLLVMLGLNTVKTLAMTTAVQQFFSRFNQTFDDPLRRFWLQSLKAALIAETLARTVGHENPREAYLAGLLHKLGQLALLHQHPEQYRDMLAGAEDGSALLQREREHFNIDHAQLGAAIVRTWPLDSFLADAIEFQHAEAAQLQGMPLLVRLVNVSRALAQARFPLDAHTYAASAEALDIHKPLLDDLFRQMEQQARQAASALGLALEADPPPQADEATALKLAGRIRDLALLQAPREALSRAENVAEILALARRDLRLLFGVHRAVFFLQQADGSLVSDAAAQPARLSSLRVRPQSHDCLISCCLQQRDSLWVELPAASGASLIDIQLGRLLGTPRLLALPLLLRQDSKGVLLIACQAQEGEHLQQRLPLLQLYAQEVAQALQQLEQRQAAAQQAVAELHLKGRQIVHEASNPLSLINNYLHLLGEKLGEDHAAHAELQVIREEIDRVGRLLLGLRETGQNAGEDAAGTDLNPLLEELLQLFQRSLFTTHGIELDTDFDADLPLLRIDRNRMKQIVTNLVKNAAEAMPEGGCIHVATRDRIVLDGKPHVEIAIADNGQGISDDIMQRLFQPVTSTKTGGHAGLGLAIVKRLVDEMGGLISCQSRPGQGTRFQILLPRRPAGNPTSRERRDEMTT